ncbi:MAG: hypothetical protein AAGB01_04075 [Cyanobacteria bacterium P01_F01_bin.42]
MKSRFILALFLPLCGLAACNSNLSSQTILEERSSDSDLMIEVISGLPSSSFGPHPVRVYISKGDKRDLLIRTPIFNDGKSLTKDNAQVTFEGDKISVCLLGTAPAGKLITFNADTRDYQVQEAGCEVE